MPIKIVCSNCDAVLNAPENVLGKRVKCKKCGEAFTARAAKYDDDFEDEDEAPRRATKKSRPRDEEDDEDEPPRKSPKRASQTEEPDEDEEDEEPPARSRKKKGKKKKSRTLLFVLLGVGGLFLLCGGGCAIGIYSAVSEGSPREFSSAEGTFTAKFPGTPNRKEDLNGRISYELEFWKTAYMVFVEKLEKLTGGRLAITDADVRDIYAKMEQGFVGKGNQQIVRKNTITHDGFSGLELEMKDSDGITLILRFFITSKNVVIIAHGAKGAIDTAKANRFFESLKILDPKPPKAR